MLSDAQGDKRFGDFVPDHVHIFSVRLKYKLYFLTYAEGKSSVSSREWGFTIFVGFLPVFLGLYSEFLSFTAHGLGWSSGN